MDSFSHFIITRFNISSLPKGESPVCGKEYLDYRFPLFEKFCLPSVKNQTCKNFRWLVLFDINTPEEYKQRAAQWHSDFPNLIPCYLDYNAYGKPDYEKEAAEIECNGKLREITATFIADTIRLLSPEKTEWYLTTRLDSDDALHRKMVESVQKRFTANPCQTVFDYPYSYKFIKEEKVVYRYTLLNGHFMTMAETAGPGFRSVLFYNHLRIADNEVVQHLFSHPLQTELIHGGNVVNGYTELTVRGLLYAFLYFRKKNFRYRGVTYSRVKALWMIGSLLKRKIWHR